MLLPPPYSFRRRVVVDLFKISALLYVLLIAFKLIFSLLTGDTITQSQMSMPPPPLLHQTRLALAAGTGVFIINTAHILRLRVAFFKSSYRSWLALSPWRPGIPQPVGPAYFHPSHLADISAPVVLSLAFAIVLGADPLLTMSYSALGWLAAEALVIPLLLLPQCRRLELRFIFTIIPLAVVLQSHAIALVILLLALVIIHRRAYLDRGKRKPIRTRVRPSVRGIYNQILPTLPSRPTINPTLNILILGWWLFAICSATLTTQADKIPPAAPALIFLLAFVAAGVRALLLGGSNPLPWLTRIRTGMLFFPRYDVAYPGFLLTLFLGPSLYFLLSYYHVYLPLTLAVSATVIMLCAAVIPPYRRRWHFTGGWSTDTRITDRIRTRNPLST